MEGREGQGQRSHLEFVYHCKSLIFRPSKTCLFFLIQNVQELITCIHVLMLLEGVIYENGGPYLMVLKRPHPAE